MIAETKGKKSKIVFIEGYRVICQETVKKWALRGMFTEKRIAEDNSSAPYAIRNKSPMKHTIKKSERSVLSWANQTVENPKNIEQRQL